MSRLLKNHPDKITQIYKKGKHNGIDIVGKTATGGSALDYILAHSSGTVVWINNYNKTNVLAIGNNSYGNAVKIKHYNGMYTLYAHLKTINVQLNQVVNQGDIIGYMGNTGRSHGGHLHFEVRDAKNTRIDPTPYINSDLPFIETKGYYQAYDNKKNKWLGRIEIGSNDYAGNKGNGISGLKIENCTYRVHDKVKNKWLNWIDGTSGSGVMGYAGNLPNDIDAVQIKGKTYRVYDNQKKRWLTWINGVEGEGIHSYAGNLGHSIGAIQIK